MNIDQYSRPMKMILTLLISMSIITSCQRNEHVFAKEDLSQPKTILDASYGADTAQRMDIYLPVNRSTSSTKSIILIHGGGWNGGDKQDFSTYIDSFRKRMPDYAVFNLNYRLVNGSNLFPTQEQDVKAAIDFIVGYSKKFGINKSKIVLLGASAGGHLALLQGYKYNSPDIAAIIDFFGPTDLVAMFEKPWHPYVPFVMQMVTGTTPSQNQKLYQESSPINYVSAHSAPTLILHGSNDNVVNVSQSKLLKAKLDKAEVKNELVIYPGKAHGWYGETLSNSFDRIEQFLLENVR